MLQTAYAPERKEIMEVLVAFVLFGIPILAIAIRAGFNPITSFLLVVILTAIPFGLLLALILLAFKDWPVCRSSTTKVAGASQ